MNNLNNKLIRTIAVIGALALVGVPAQAGFKLGLSAYYFSFKDATYESFYGSGGPAFGASAGLETSKIFEIRAEIGSFKDKGAMSVSGQPLTLTLRPFLISVRLRPLKLGRFRPYVGAGLGTMAIREDYPEGISDYSDSSGLSMLEAGIDFSLMKRVHLAAGLRFTNAKATSASLDQTIELGGMRPGLEISYTF